MPRSLKIHACVTLLLAVLFYVFWNVSKHQPALALVNVFADDPYDAVSSFAVQFALLAALLSFLRAFRPYPANGISQVQSELFTGGAYLTFVSIGVVLLTNVIAMIRHIPQWAASPAGYVLALLMGGLGLLTLAASWSLHHAADTTRVQTTRAAWITALSCSLAGVLILSVYPESWRQNLYGELFTIVLGMSLFLVVTWGWGNVVAPAPRAQFEDIIDDLTAIYRWLTARGNLFRALARLCASIYHWPVLHAATGWLNPRRHTWNGIILLGIIMGALMAFFEAMSEGGPGGHFPLILAIFVSMESLGVLLGYTLFRKPLGLFRRAAPVTS
jgi:hypothetical protein